MLHVTISSLQLEIGDYISDLDCLKQHTVTHPSASNIIITEQLLFSGIKSSDVSAISFSYFALYCEE